MNINKIIACFLIFVSALFFIVSMQMKNLNQSGIHLSPALFPIILSVFLCMLSLLLFFQKHEEATDTRDANQEEEKPQQPDQMQSTESVSEKKAASKISYIAATLVYLLLIPYLGFMFSTALLLLFLCREIGLLWSRRLLYIACVLLFTHLFFAELLHISFPEGYLGFLSG